MKCSNANGGRDAYEILVPDRSIRYGAKLGYIIAYRNYFIGTPVTRRSIGEIMPVHLQMQYNSMACSRGCIRFCSSTAGSKCGLTATALSADKTVLTDVTYQWYADGAAIGKVLHCKATGKTVGVTGDKDSKNTNAVSVDVTVAADKAGYYRVTITAKAGSEFTVGTAAAEFTVAKTQLPAVTSQNSTAIGKILQEQQLKQAMSLKSQQ